MAISVIPAKEHVGLAGWPLPEVLTLPEPFPSAVAVNRTVLKVVQMTDYTYAIPARQVVTDLRLMPPIERGWQTRLSHDLRTAPLPHTTLSMTDALGNDYYQVRHERVQEHLTFATRIEVMTHCAYTEEGLPLPTPVPLRAGESAMTFRGTTGRTTPDSGMRSLVDDICSQFADRRPSLELFAAVCRRVHTEMHFDSAATSVQTTAAEAWSARRGVCQDYSHITLTLARMCGIAARYVSGFVPGEGVMHAWVEGWLPIRVQGRVREFWFAYDPTYNKWVDDNYVTVAVGRDYGDITPSSGTYFGGKSVMKYRNKVTVSSKKIHLL